MRLFEDYYFPHTETHIECDSVKATQRLYKNLRFELKERGQHGIRICKDTKHCIVTIKPWTRDYHPVRKYQEQVAETLRDGHGIIQYSDTSDNHAKNALRYELKKQGQDSHCWRFHTTDKKKRLIEITRIEVPDDVEANIQ